MTSKLGAFYMMHPHWSKEAFAALSEGDGVYQRWVQARQTCLVHRSRTARGLAARNTPELAACGTWALAELQRLCHMAMASPTGGE